MAHVFMYHGQMAKQDPFLRVQMTREDLDEVKKIAAQYGYRQLAPFIRHLLNVAKNGNLRTGEMHFFEDID